jgi:hypothetical protein
MWNVRVLIVQSQHQVALVQIGHALRVQRQHRDISRLPLRCECANLCCAAVSCDREELRRVTQEDDVGVTFTTEETAQ